MKTKILLLYKSFPAVIILMLTTVLNGCDKHQQHYQGYVEGENIYIASPYSGNLAEVLVERGQKVRKGDLLFRLDADPQKLMITEAVESLKQAKEVYEDLLKPRRKPELTAIEAKIGQVNAQLSLAGLRVKRNQTLYAKHVLDKDTLDASMERYNELSYLKTQYEANLDYAKMGGRENLVRAQAAQASMLAAKLAQVEWQLKQKSFYAPADGIVFDNFFYKGEFVPSQHPVAAILTPDNINIEFFVPDSALATLHVNKKITFGCEGCSKNNQAVVQYISPEAEYVPPLVYSRENRDKLIFRIKASPEKPMNFKPGQPVVVTVSKDE